MNETRTSDQPHWTLTTVEDVDELYSELMYMPPAIVVTPDRRVWEVWVTFDDETLQLRRLDGPAGVDWQTQTDTFDEAFRHLRDGAVIHRG